MKKDESGSGRRGGTRRIGDLPVVYRCRHREHEPAKHVVRRPGVYEHVCPGCGQRSVFTVQGASW